LEVLNALLAVSFIRILWVVGAGGINTASPSLVSLAFCDGTAHMWAISKTFDPTDYSVVVKNRAPLPRPWEIYCAGKRQPIKRSSVLYESRGEASMTGKEALAELLERLGVRY
jgi:hypothetical protein